jgi:hypothetical protein
MRCRHFQQYFIYIVAVSFIGGRKPMYSKKTTDLLEGTDKLDRAHLATFNNILFRSWRQFYWWEKITDLLEGTDKLDLTPHH